MASGEITVVPWESFSRDIFLSLSVGYVSNELLRLTREEADALTTFRFELEKLPEPFVKRWEHRSELVNFYGSLVRPGGLCFLAKDGEATIGLVIAGTTPWNGTVNLWEFHVAEGHRGRGVGKLMMATLADEARKRSFRVIEVETANRNVPAIRAYRAMGFTIEKFDMSFYSNDDFDKQEVALFMKLRL